MSFKSYQQQQKERDAFILKYGDAANNIFNDINKCKMMVNVLVDSERRLAETNPESIVKAFLAERILCALGDIDRCLDTIIEKSHDEI